MVCKQSTITFKQSDQLTKSGIRHGFFTRNGGVSSGIYTSLNMGYGSADDEKNVTENRQHAAKTLGLEKASIATPYQHHSNKVIVLENLKDFEQDRKADGIVTKQKNIIIGVLTADCAPVLFYEPNAQIIGAVHAGWRGAFAGIIENTAKAICDLGGQKKDIIMSVGPCLSQGNYEVGPEFFKQFIAKDKEHSNFFKLNENTQKQHFNLKSFVESAGLKAGITKIDIASDCTYENESDFFSYRRSCHKGEQDYGRQISVIALT